MNNFSYIQDAIKIAIKNDQQLKLLKNSLRIQKKLLAMYNNSNCISELEKHRAFIEVLRYEAMIKQCESDIILRWLKNNQI